VISQTVPPYLRYSPSRTSRRIGFSAVTKALFHALALSQNTCPLPEKAGRGKSPKTHNASEESPGRALVSKYQPRSKNRKAENGKK
jgi:hypothetical protein